MILENLKYLSGVIDRHLVWCTLERPLLTSSQQFTAIVVVATSCILSTLLNGLSYPINCIP